MPEEGLAGEPTVTLDPCRGPEHAHAVKLVKGFTECRHSALPRRDDPSGRVFRYIQM